MNSGNTFAGTRTLGMIWIAVSLLIVIGASRSLAQLPTATILGTVKDASGAVVPDAALTARNIETGLSRNTVSASDGSYRFSALPIGNYEVHAEHSGFRTDVRSGLTLSVSQEAVVNFTLEVGAVEQTVAVTAEAPLVNTTSGALGGLVNEARIAELPLNGRNYIDMTLLQPGVSQSINRASGQAGIGTDFSSNGATIYSNHYMLDGASMANFFGGTSSSGSGTTLGLDGIQEYRVVTNAFSAEYGMKMGSQMTIVSKSGTNKLHGSLFEYLRNSALDARNYFDYTTTSTPGRLPPFKRNNFGASLGGPLRKDKTFIFGVYEGLRERKGLTNIVTSIADGCHGPANATVTNTACPQISAVNPSVTNVTIAPVIAPFLPYFPAPNLAQNQFTYGFSQPTTVNYGQTRVDQNFSAADAVFGRYTIDDNQLLTPVSWPGFLRTRPSRNQYVTVSENHIFSPALLNTARFSFSRALSAQVNILPAGLSGPQFSFFPGSDVGSISVTGLSGGWGPVSGAPQLTKQNIFTWGDDVFYSRGRHALKFGTLINRYQQYALASTNVRGTISFAGVDKFLQGQPSSYSATTPGSTLDRTYHYSTLGFYVQDDIRVRSTFTLNVGLRYEFNTTYHEAHNKHAAVRNIATDPTTTIVDPFINPSLRNFSPRIGFAWDVKGDGKTAVRGGFGLLYDILTDMGTVMTNGICAPPICSSSSTTVAAGTVLTFPLSFSAAGKALRDWDYHLQQPHMLQFNFTVEHQLPGDMLFTLAYAGSRGLNLFQYNEGNPTIPLLRDGRKFWAGTEPRINPNFDTIEFHTASGDSWYNSLQFGLIKRLSKGLQFQSAYTWSKLMDTNSAQMPIESTASQQYLSDPWNEKGERAVASYDVTHNWRFNAIYRLPTFFNSGRMIGKLLNGWSTSGIVTLQTGFPFTVAEQAQRSRSKVAGGAAVTGQAVSTDRPDIVAGRNNSNITSGTTAGCPGVRAGQELGTVNLWFDPCAFTLQPVGFLGNAGRNILRGPGIANLDFSVTKDTALAFLGENGRLQFRAEIFNILNHANFTTPALGSSGVGAAGVVFAGSPNNVTELPLAAVGKITSTSTASRQIQLSLRILF